ncbi:MAG TPA: TetR/AcrR family transcriptional regulator [Caulobacteraceae bacterium]|nr:TetR/AcrR family transcriptional regulator [Caulobacteraceae bacterium]
MTETRLMRSARKPKGEGHVRRAEILRAAERIFVAEGYSGATIRKIADEVGVSSTCLYMHFRDKDEILQEIGAALMEELLAINSEIASRPIDAAARLQLMLREYVRFALRNRNAYWLVFCTPDAARARLEPGAAADIGARCSERFFSVVRELGAQGRLRSPDLAGAAQALWAGCHGLAGLMIAKPDYPWIDTERLAATLIDGLLFGLLVD